MSLPQSRLQLSDRLYRKFLVAYSSEYWEKFGDEMAQVFRDLCLEVYRERGCRSGEALGVYNVRSPKDSCGRSASFKTNTCCPYLRAYRRLGCSRRRFSYACIRVYPCQFQLYRMGFSAEVALASSGINLSDCSSWIWN
jgi:hypothetical protein